MKIKFEVHSPWNILDGIAEEVSGIISAASDQDPNSLRATVTAKDIDYKAGLSVAGRLVSAWLRANPPTPASFTIAKAALNCDPKTISDVCHCSGSVDGKLNIWAKDYNIDVPVEIKPAKTGLLLTGVKEIKWGEYGFGDSNSTLANLKPVIELNFSIELPADK